MVRERALRLLDMRSSIEAALRLADGLDKDDFDRDSVRYDACLYRIIVVAEAANGLPDEILKCAPEVPWRNLIGMGHNLKHQYFRVEADIVWDTIVHHFPALLRAVNRLLLEEPHNVA